MKSMIKRIFNAIRFGLKNKIKVGKCCLASRSTKIKVDSMGEISIGCGMFTNRNTTLHSNGGKISIGNNFFMNEGSVIVSQERIEIGNNCKIGPGVYIYDHDHDVKSHNDYKTSPVIIGDNVWIGAGAIILRGAHIGDNCVIGAGTLVKGTVEENSLVYEKRNNACIDINKL